MKDEALDLALEALEQMQARANFECWNLDICDKAITAIKQARALDKKAENARELGLDYGPADGTQVSKVWWDGEKLMAKPIPLVDFYQPVQDSTCSETLRAQGKAYPRTCRKCGKGPCIGAPKPPPTQPAPVQSCYCPNCEAMGKELAALKAQPAPVQEPVCDKDPQGCWSVRCQLGKKCKNTPPAAQRQSARSAWVGLTDEEVYPLANEHLHYQMEGYEVSGIYNLARAIEAKLKEKNT